MIIRIATVTFLLAALTLGTAAPAPASEIANVFFLHHSVGRNLVEDGMMREWFAQYDLEHGTRIDFWDHDYPYIGLRDPFGEMLGYAYGNNIGNTDPDGLYLLWTQQSASRDSVLQNHDVIAFKSCFPAAAINSDAMLQQYKTWYLEIRDVLDQHPNKVFVVMGIAPLHRNATDTDDASRVRVFADWLSSAEYLAGHPNIRCFDIFDVLAQPDDGSSAANRLRYEYEISHTGTDSHPNLYANTVVAPQLAAFLVQAAGVDGTVDVPPVAASDALRQNQPNPFNPSTSIRFDLVQAGRAVLRVHDLRGRLVATLLDADMAAGPHVVEWSGRGDDGRAAPAGTYLYQLRHKAGVLTRKMTLVE